MGLHSSLLTVLMLLDPAFVDANVGAMNVHGLLQPAPHEILINDFATPNTRLEFAAVDLCYRGSVVDSDTGEVTELYTPCSEDAIEGNLDLA
jgi:hypothetical protein